MGSSEHPGTAVDSKPSQSTPNYRGEGGSAVHHQLLLGVHLVVAVGVRLRRRVVPAPVGSITENVFVKLRERERQRVDPGRSLKGHL